jgi:hypothetical protein
MGLPGGRRVIAMLIAAGREAAGTGDRCACHWEKVNQLILTKSCPEPVTNFR